MNLPQVLFRFRPWSVLKIGEPERKSIAEIEGRFAYFSSPLRFNDPQDSLLGPEFAGGRGDIDRLAVHGWGNILHLARKKGCLMTELDSNDPEVQAEIRERERRENRTNSRVCCFSWDWSSPLLWTFYAQDHQGFCLGYGTDGDLLRRARPVIYTHSPTDVLHLEDAATHNDQLSLCKSTEWQFEKEWRVCLPEPEPKRVDLTNENLVSVHVGYRMKDAQLQELANALREAGHRPEETKLFQIERMHMSFAFCQRPIDW